MAGLWADGSIVNNGSIAGNSACLIVITSEEPEDAAELRDRNELLFCLFLACTAPSQKAIATRLFRRRKNHRRAMTTARQQAWQPCCPTPLTILITGRSTAWCWLLTEIYDPTTETFSATGK